MVITLRVLFWNWILSLGFEQYIDSQKEKATAEKDEEYIPYEHLRTVTEDSSFYTMEFKVDIDKDILGK